LGEEGEGEEWLKKLEEWRGIECKAVGIEERKWECGSDREGERERK